MTGRDVLTYICDILEMELGLMDGMVFIYNQKYNLPEFSGLLIAVGVQNVKPFGASSTFDNGIETQTVNLGSTLSIDIMSRDSSAIDRKEEVVMALQSILSQSVQEMHGFKIGKMPIGFMNLSEIDGAAIPFRFNISYQIQYSLTKTKSVDYYDSFEKKLFVD